MKCLIIAAGRGSRLSQIYEPKPLIPILGVPIIERIIRICLKVGINEFYIVLGYKNLEIEDYLKKFSIENKLKIKIVFNENWKKGSGSSVLAAKDFIYEKFILLMSDHLFDESILRQLLKSNLSTNEVILAVDKNIKNNNTIDVDDVTKVLTQDNLVKDIGKCILNYNAYDMGIFYCSPIIFLALEESIGSGKNSLSDGIRIIAKKNKLQTIDMSGFYWVDIDNKDDINKAEKLLIESVKKRNDNILAKYLKRPISTSITKYMSKIKIVTPNVITVLSFIFSIFAGIFVLKNGYINLVIGAILSQIGFILDACDGELARLKYKISFFGGWIDTILDKFSESFLLLCIMFNIYNKNNVDAVIVLGFLSIFGILLKDFISEKYKYLLIIRNSIEKYNFKASRNIRIYIIFIFLMINKPLFILVLISVIVNFESIRELVLLYINRKRINLHLTKQLSRQCAV